MEHILVFVYRLLSFIVICNRWSKMNESRGQCSLYSSGNGVFKAFFHSQNGNLIIICEKIKPSLLSQSTPSKTYLVRQLWRILVCDRSGLHCLEVISEKNKYSLLFKRKKVHLVIEKKHHGNTQAFLSTFAVDCSTIFYYINICQGAQTF